MFEVTCSPECLTTLPQRKLNSPLYRMLCFYAELSYIIFRYSQNWWKKLDQPAAQIHRDCILQLISRIVLKMLEINAFSGTGSMKQNTRGRELQSNESITLIKPHFCNKRVIYLRLSESSTFSLPVYMYAKCNYELI